MPTITYLLPDGSTRTIEAMAGENAMQIAVEHDVEGILGRCGGYCQCGTCHVYVDPDWADKLPEPYPEEDMMLDGTPAERLPNSRLSCQIVLSDELDGLVVTVADTQE